MRRGTIVLVLIGLIAFAIGGCAPSHSDIEKSIKEEMKSKLNVNITAVNLMKQGDGSYIGTATADIGRGEHVHTHNLESDYLPTYTHDAGKSFVTQR